MRSRLIFLCLVQLLVAFEFSSINVALPTLRSGIGLPPGQTHYLLSVFAISFASSLLLGGKFSDLFGGYRTLIVAMTLFSLSAAVAALAEEFPELLIARGLQGVSAAICIPAALSMLTSLAKVEQRAALIGVWGGSGAFGFALGVVIGGLIVDWVGWRGIFWFCCLFGLFLAISVTILFAQLEKQLQKRKCSLTGGFLFALASAATAYALATTSDPYISTSFKAVAWGGTTIFALLFAVHQMSTPDPEFPRAFITRPQVLSGNLLGMFVTISGGSMVYLASEFMAFELGLTATQLGLVFIPDALAAAYGARIAPRLLWRHGFGKTMAIGLFAVCGGMFLIACADVNQMLSSLSLVILGSVMVGFGMVLASASSIIEVSKELRGHEHGLSAGLINATQQWGLGLGAAFVVPMGVAIEEWFDINSIRASLIVGAATAFLFIPLTWLLTDKRILRSRRLFGRYR